MLDLGSRDPRALVYFSVRERVLRGGNGVVAERGHPEGLVYFFWRLGKVEEFPRAENRSYMGVAGRGPVL
jgi:hypothetical protein